MEVLVVPKALLQVRLILQELDTDLVKDKDQSETPLVVMVVVLQSVVALRTHMEVIMDLVKVPSLDLVRDLELELEN